EIPLPEAKPGDLVLFTGTDSTRREVGHMGIIVSNQNNEYSFIHSTSGKQHSVTVTPLNQYYMGRFLKVIRVFGQNDGT
ncbi:MAG: C40 family peptidase, partial [Segetibacter sp.]|nr:C40 family peptidase [Segetibacter sp.]